MSFLKIVLIVSGGRDAGVYAAHASRRGSDAKGAITVARKSKSQGDKQEHQPKAEMQASKDALEEADQGPSEEAAADEDALAAAQEPAPVPESVVDDHDDHTAPHRHKRDEEEHSASLSSFVLRALLWMCIGAGLALWGGPKLAPYLPAGLQPVADFFAPGQGAARDAQEEVARLSERLDALGGETQELRAATEASQESLSVMTANLATLTAAQEQLQAQADEEAVSGPDEEMQQAVAGLSTQTQQLRGDVDALLLGLKSMQEAEPGAAVSLDAYQIELEALSGRVAALEDTVQTGWRAAQEDAAAAVTQAQEDARAEAQKASLLQSLAAIDEALDQGADYSASLETLRALQESGALQDVTIPAAVEEAAAARPGLNALRSGFDDLAFAAIEADQSASSEGGVLGGVRSLVQSQFVTRSMTPQEGESADAVLSRMEAALRSEDLGRVLQESEALSEAARAPLSEWLTALRSIQNAKSAMRDLQAFTQ